MSPLCSHSPGGAAVLLPEQRTPRQWRGVGPPKPPRRLRVQSRSRPPPAARDTMKLFHPGSERNGNRKGPRRAGRAPPVHRASSDPTARECFRSPRQTVRRRRRRLHHPAVEAGTVRNRRPAAPPWQIPSGTPCPGTLHGTIPEGTRDHAGHAPQLPPRAGQ